jgi:hypothetical protein
MVIFFIEKLKGVGGICLRKLFEANAVQPDFSLDAGNKISFEADR